MTSTIDISSDHMGMVLDILQRHLKSDVRVWVFGSRAKWVATNVSDLDLALKGVDKIENKIMDALEYDFEESDLPYTVDVVDLHQVNHKFRQIIEAQMIPFPIIKNMSDNTNN